MDSQIKSMKGGWKLVIAILSLLFVWLVVLPSVSRLPIVRNHIEPLEQRRIHPDAMFYTELQHGSG